jgi:hypothetical protein
MGEVTMEKGSTEDRERIERTFAALKPRGIDAVFIVDRHEALATVLTRIPKGAAVAHGSSTTLSQIGFADYMKRPDSGYRYMNDEWTKEDDPTKRTRLRTRLTMEAHVFLGSVQAIGETGEVIAADGGAATKSVTSTVRHT